MYSWEVGMGQNIQNGYFGYNGPIQQFGNVGYNQQYYDPGNGVQSYNVFSQYQQPYQYYQQSYYGQYQQPYYWNNWTPSPAQYQRVLDEEKQYMQTKLGFLESYYDTKVDQDKLDQKYKVKIPKRPEYTPEQIAQREMMAMTAQTDDAIARMEAGTYITPAQMTAIAINRSMEEYHNKYDDHSLYQFLAVDAGMMLRQQWMEEHLDMNQRNIRGMYNSNDYNQLLGMHRNSSAYVNHIMDNSMYDNNVSDEEIGLAAAMAKNNRRFRWEEPLPAYISSPEVQAARRAFTQELNNMLYEKNSSKLVRR